MRDSVFSFSLSMFHPTPLNTAHAKEELQYSADLMFLLLFAQFLLAFIVKLNPKSLIDELSKKQ